MRYILIITLTFNFLCLNNASAESCELKKDELYSLFKLYREAIDSYPESVKDYFSNDFHNYHRKKIKNAKNEKEKKKYKDQYYYNLITGLEVKMVYSQNQYCIEKRKSYLEMEGISYFGSGTKISRAKPVNIKINYVKENGEWGISDFLFDRTSAVSNQIDTSKIIDQFIN